MLRRLNLTARDWQTAKAWLARQIVRPRAASTDKPRLFTPLFQARDRARHRRQPDSASAPLIAEDITAPPVKGRAPIKPPGAQPPHPHASNIADEPTEQRSSPDETAQDQTAQDSLARLREAKKRARR
jgi:hypothetical protein